MGEYARRASDGVEVKIGTCENMYYLRYEDRMKVLPLKGNIDIARQADGCRFRLPFPDEDGVPIGEYKDPFRSERLYTKCSDTGYFDSFEDAMPELVKSLPSGTMQLTHDGGLSLSIPCYHGAMLPDLGEDAKARWNGKSWFIVLSSLRIADGKVHPVIKCRHCSEQWRIDWPTILPFVPTPLRERLAIYA